MQIRKYLNGELDAKAMHQLEKQAQDDPFLMDALEGYSNAAKDQQANLDELSALLQQRARPAEKRIIPFWMIAAAASVLVVLSIGGYLFFSNHPGDTTRLATVVKQPETKPAPLAETEVPAKKEIVDSPASPVLQAAPAKQIARVKRHVKDKEAKSSGSVFDNLFAGNPKTADSDATPLNEMVVMDYSARHNDKKNAVAPNVLTPANAIQRKTPGLFIINNSALSKRILEGRVIGRDDGLPAVGASVTVPGTNTSAVTDVNGRFTIPIDSNKNNVVIAYIGYYPKVVNIHNPDSLNAIAMVPSKNSLAEVSTTAFAVKQKKAAIGSVSNAVFKKDSSAGDKLIESRNAEVATPNPMPAQNGYLLSGNLISGRVISRDDGLPLPGVTIKLTGTNKATQTDINGRFKLRADSSRRNITIASIGYQSKQIRVNKRDSLQTITLEPANSSLNEVVVAGYSSRKNDDDNAVIIDARPKGGWSSFRKYLRDNAISPDKKAGIVKLSFSIQADGTISDIKIVKGLSVATDKKAIEMLNNGPDWIGSSTKKPEKQSIRIKFGN